MMRKPIPLLVALSVAAAFGVAGCGGDDSGGGDATPVQDVGDPVAGKAVFAARCTSCHLGDGTEDGGAGPNLSGKGSNHTPEQLEAVVVEGRGAMPAGIVSGTDLDNVVAYVYSLK
jgi:cytochrome c551